MGCDVVKPWTRTESRGLNGRSFDRDTLRALVDYRFSAQGRRKATDNQIGAIERCVDTAPDLSVLNVLSSDFRLIEAKADKAIKAMVESHDAGRWAVSIPGIAHTFAGVLLAYVDLRPWHCASDERTSCSRGEPCTADCADRYVNTAGKLWSFFGVNPTQRRWEKGERRPYCALGKTLVWQIGESFKKLGTDHPSLYARLYRQRKALEIERNEAGAFEAQALARLAMARAKKWRISKLQRDTWASGRLQPIGLDYRAGRYAAKMFLSHFHHVLHEVELGTPPPVPYIIGVGGHANYIPPPNWPME